MENKSANPPRFAKWILHRLAEYQNRYSIVGDLEEGFQEIRDVSSRFGARLWYWMQTIDALRNYLRYTMYRSLSMFKSYVKTGMRNAKRQKAYSVINVSGLAIGMACCLLIVLYVKNELSYDLFNDNASRIYRVANTTKFGDKEFDTPIYTAEMGLDLEAEFAAVEHVVRFSMKQTKSFWVEGKSYKEDAIYYADDDIFDVFSYTLVIGDPKTVLTDPFSIVLTEELAQKFYGNENPVGKIIRQDDRYDLTVTGVMKNPPSNSHLRFTALLSFNSLYNMSMYFMDWNGGHGYYTYALLNENSFPAAVEEKFPAFVKRHTPFLEGRNVTYDFYLQPLRDIHLYVQDNISGVYIYSAIAAIILIISYLNFINLTISMSTRRSKEVGMRKVMGAEKKTLVKQFLGESVLLSMAGLVLAVLLVNLALPLYNTALRTDFTLSTFLDAGFVAGIVISIILAGVIAGSYPAFYLSRFSPSQVISGKGGLKGEKNGIRNALVVAQFAISIALVFSTTTIYRQLDFMKNKELGFIRENVVIIPLMGKESRERVDLLKSEFLTIPGVVKVGASSDYPAHNFTMNGYIPEDMTESILFYALDIDYDYLETMGITVKEGRNFSREQASDQSAILINESLANKLGWENPVGRIINRSYDRTVIGVVKDFNFQSLHQKIEPLLITIRPYQGYSFLSVRASRENMSETINSLRTKWEGVVPSNQFSYTFLDNSLDAAYGSEQRFAQIFIYFTSLAIILACMGLFGLALFTAGQRTKEIGIRKVLGASARKIVTLLLKDFIQWVVLANVIAWPIAWYIMDRWLADFAYRMDLGVSLFFVSGALALVVALLTVGYQALKSALSNPVKSLKYE